MSEFKTFEDMKNDIPEGATHYSDETDGDFFAWFKVDGDTTYSVMPDSKNFNSWEVCVWKNMFSRAKPIPAIPKTRTRAEYEKVAGSIFGLRDEFERGELYFDRDRCTGGIYASSDQYQKIRDMNDFSQAALNNNIYRKVEKEIDWQDEVVHAYPSIDFKDLDSDGYRNLGSWRPDKFLELCRVALRANGEIEW